MIDLQERIASGAPQAYEWPKLARTLSTSLKRLAPVLRTNGVEFERDKSNGQRLITLRKLAT